MIEAAVTDEIVSRAFSVAGLRAVVVGAARSGIAAAELLAARGAIVTLSEERDTFDERARLERLGIGMEVGGNRAATLAGADLVVLSPGVRLDRPAVAAARDAGVPIISEIELASRLLRGRIVAVTGTKGKSTTATLTAAILRAGGRDARVGGNIGVALSSQVEDSRPDVVHVVEVSSFQLAQTVTFHPWIAVFTNFSPDHLDWHGSESDYAAAKARVFANQTAADWAVVNADDPRVVEMARRGRARRLAFALDRHLDEGIVVAGDWIVRRDRSGDRGLVPLARVTLRGRHLLADVLAAVSVGVIAGAAPDAMTAAVAAFRTLEHVLEPAGSIGAVQFFNDSKATNVDAARRALESFGGNLVPILGGRFKGGDFANLRGALEARARAVVAIGEARPLVSAALAGVVPVHEAATMREAVRLAYDLAKPEGTVLLAPACASFDMFRDYAERGRVFKEEVSRLAGEAANPGEQ
jgi:UDP-N-acetylmuramoylalanine--D-glutamate ligase